MGERHDEARGSSEQINLQAEVLRERKAALPDGGTLGFGISPEPPAAADGCDGARRDAAVRRAIAIAREAGISAYRIEIAPDGSVTLIVDCDPAAGQAG